MGYRAMSLADLAGFMQTEPDERVRWRLVAEFLEEYRWEPAERHPDLLAGEPAGTGDERWDVFLAALAEHLAAQRAVAARNGAKAGRCGGSGSRSTHRPRGSTRSSTRQPRSAAVASSSTLRNCTSHDRTLARPLAGRRRDAPDIEVLVRMLGLSTVDEVLAVCADVFPDEPVPDRARLMIEDLLRAPGAGGAGGS